MRLSFRHGIVSHQSGGFLSLNGSGHVDIVANDRAVTMTIAHRDTNYTHIESKSVTNAWLGPFDSGTDYWLYWDFNPLTFVRTFGKTDVEPIVQSTEPASALRQVGRHWYDTTNNKHFVWQGSFWSEVIRLFAAKVINGSTFIPLTININSFIGTQIGDTSQIRSGRVLFDDTSKPLRRSDGTLFTSEDEFFVNATRATAIRLEANIIQAQVLNEQAIAAFTVVSWVGDGEVQTAEYNDAGTTVVGVLTESVTIGNAGAVVVQGVVTNPSWSWTTGGSAVPVGTPLWIDAGVNKGQLTPVDPHTVNASAYPAARVPIARVLSNDTVIFEQGLGGRGERGPSGSVENLPPAEEEALGAVLLSTPPTVAEFPVVVSDTDPRLTDARTPLAHTHAATEVSFTPASGGVTSNNVQGAIGELGTNKVNKSGGTMTGFLSLHADPTNNTHAATKRYVDGLVSGLLWIDPICLVNLISDALTSPPVSPNTSDVYIVADSATGAWAGLDGHVVIWDGTQWLDRGLLSAFTETRRFGVSMRSTTVAGGTFTGHDNKIAIWDPDLETWTFYTPIENNAAWVCNEYSLHAYHHYVFDGSSWIEFGGTEAIQPGTNLEFTGSVLDVKQASAGGTVDAATLEGNGASAFALANHNHDSDYAAIDHDHSIPYDVSFFIKNLQETDDIVGMVVFPREVSVDEFAPGSIATCETAPAATVTLNLVAFESGNVGDIEFTTASNVGTISWYDNYLFDLGEKFYIKTDSTIDITIKDICIVIVGCSLAEGCTMNTGGDAGPPGL